MSDKRRFYELICELAQAGRWDALERIEMEFDDILAQVQAKHAILKGWKDEHQRTNDN